MAEEFDIKQVNKFLDNNKELKDKLSLLGQDLRNIIVRGQLHDNNGNFKASMIYTTIALYIACGNKNIEVDQVKIIEKLAIQARNRFETQIKNAAMGGEDKDSVQFKPVDEKTIVDRPTGLPLDYNNLIGMHREKNEMSLKFILPQLNPELFFTSTNNALFFGPPGTGKTMLAKASVVEFNRRQQDEFQAIFFNETASSLKSKWEGGTEKQIQQLFEEADKQAKEKQEELRKLPNKSNIKVLSVIFLDEIEEITLSRSISDKSGSTVTTLLQQMGGLKTYDNVSVIAATNYPWNIDDAIMRRFPTKIFVDLSDGYTRFHMLCISILQKFLSIEPSRLCEFKFQDIEDLKSMDEFDRMYTEFKKTISNTIDENTDEKTLFPSKKMYSKHSSDGQIELRDETNDEKKYRKQIFTTSYLQNKTSIQEFIKEYQISTLIPHLKQVLNELVKKDKAKYSIQLYTKAIDDLRTNKHITNFLTFMFFISLYIGPDNYSYRSGFVKNRFTYDYTHTRFGYSNSDIIALVTEFFTKMAQSILNNRYADSGKTNSCDTKKIFHKKKVSDDKGYHQIKKEFVKERATVNYMHMKEALNTFRPSSNTPNYCSHVCYNQNKDNPESCAETCEQIRNDIKKEDN